MRFAVPLLIEISIPQSEISRKIDDMFGFFSILGDIVLGLAMGEGEEKDTIRVLLLLEDGWGRCLV